jgi:hypothetical protein
MVLRTMSMLLQVMRSLESILRSNVYLNRKNLYEHRRDREEQLAEHRAIYEAIMTRDASSAERAARLHMVSTMQTQREIHEEEQRLEAAIRRLARNELLAVSKTGNTSRRQNKANQSRGRKAKCLEARQLTTLGKINYPNLPVGLASDLTLV